jgi:hypothetical protein
MEVLRLAELNCSIGKYPQSLWTSSGDVNSQFPLNISGPFRVKQNALLYDIDQCEVND